MRPTPLVFLAVVLGATVAARADIRPDSVRIARVTVYADRAEVVREAKLQLRVGDSEVVVDGIPEGVEPDSIRVRAHGTPAALGAVQIRQEIHQREGHGDPEALQREVQRLTDAIAALDGEAAVDAELQAFLASMKTVTSSVAKGPSGEGRVDARSVGDMYAFVGTSLAELKQRELARAVQRRALNEQLGTAQAALAAARPPAWVSRSAAVEVHTERGGALTLELAYLLPRAGWRPVYR
ncbi:MAG TPA: DUF4140 domain-containing protein, partial [Candidatus Polarisedimenticolaceae bacterium]|nr:DUF4140 domain-containing protein [Candidatus Polarisedimenticolaceae bacterium]